MKSQNTANEKIIFLRNGVSVFYLLACSVVEYNLYPGAIPGTAGTLSAIDVFGSIWSYNSAGKDLLCAMHRQCCL